MKYLSALLLSILLILCSFIARPVLVLAQDKQAEKKPFATHLESNYSASKSGITTVTHTFKLVNQTPTLFVKNYGMKLSSAIDSKSVVVTHNGKPIDANVVEGKEGTSIGLSFTEPIVGEGKTQTITIQYPDTDVALITGQVLEVHIPKLSEKESFDSYAITIRTPEEFGPPTQSTTQNYTTATINGEVLTQLTAQNAEAISLYYGSKQAFDVTLKYHLENPETSVRLVQIALPPDTRWQRVHYTTLNPLPSEITPDLDGNWIATYELQPQSTVEVQAQVQFHLSLDPDLTVPQIEPLTQHTTAQTYWDSNDQQIRDLAQQYTTPKAIHEYVVGALDYFLPANATVDENTEFPKRLGAAGVLEQPTMATCQEFTDLFVGIARAANIPSRRITGYAYTQNSQLRPLSLLEDVLHAWPEYYDSTTSMWRPIDPTWEKTTKGVNYFDQLDLNHLVFAINGVTSSTPYPAGSYKDGDKTSKDVEVVFATAQLEPTFDVSTELTPVTVLGFHIPGKYELALTNKAGTAWYGVSPNLTLTSDADTITLYTSEQNPQIALLPWQTHKLDVTVYTNEWLPTREATVNSALSHLDQTYEQHSFTITAAPKIWTVISHPVILIAMGTSCLGFAVLTGSLLVQRRKQSRTVRR